MDSSFKTFLIVIGIVAGVITIIYLFFKIEGKIATKSSDKYMKKLDEMINSASENLTKT